MTDVATCPVCDGLRLAPYAASAPEPNRLHFRQVSCGDCGLVISQPQASAADMDRYYREVYYERNWPDAEAIAAENSATYQRYELPLMKRLWSNWPPPSGASIAEIGCGYGVMLPLLQAEGFRVFGCDPSRDAVEFCRRRGLDVVEGSLPGTSLAAGPFDVTITQHVIEHVPNPRSFVASLVRLTRPGGIVAVVTEDAWNTQYAWERALARLRGGVPAFRSSFDHTFVFNATHLDPIMSVNRIFLGSGHQFIFDFESMRHLLANNGFENITREHFRTGRDPKLVRDSESRQVESLYIEASKPV